MEVGTTVQPRPDYDVAVVGGGVAGLSAAIRVRFVKSMEALPLSVVVFECSTPGGLVRVGQQRYVTGPSFRLDARNILGDLLKDIEQYEIPILRTRITSVGREGEIFVLEGDDGSRTTALSVVIATGSRPLCNELEFLGKGVFITYKGLSFLPLILDEAVLTAGGKTVAVVTNRRIGALLPLFGNRKADFLYLLFPPSRETGGLTMPGRTVEIAGFEVRKVAGGFELDVRSLKGEKTVEECGAVLLDYVSFQTEPSMPVCHTNLAQESEGVPKVDSFLASSLPGLYFAGDVTCRYANTAAAISDGVLAGFGAYSHAYRALFGHSPPLFAYRAPESPGRFLAGELPALTDRYRIRWLQTPPPGHPLRNSNGRTVGEAAADSGLSGDKVKDLAYEAIRAKSLTVYPPDARPETP